MAEEKIMPFFSSETVQVNSSQTEEPSAQTSWRMKEGLGSILRIEPGKNYRQGTFSLLLESTEPVEKPWLVIEFHMRSVPSGGQSSQVGMEVELRGKKTGTGQWEKLFTSPATVGLQWERIQFSVELEQVWDAGNLQVIIRPLYFSPITEIADLKVRAVSDKPDLSSGIVYPGQEMEAPWRAKAAERIRNHRQGPLTIRLIDRDGRPVQDATVKIVQQQHAYPFGTAVVSQRIVDGPRYLYDPDFTQADQKKLNAENAVYREKLKSLFNYVVIENDLKWPNWSRPHSRSRPEWTLEALQWLDQNDFLIKGHTLVWGSWRMVPEWLRQYESDPEALQQRILEHIADIGAATRDYVDQWDVLNEPMSHRDIIEICGMEGVAEWFKKAREVMPEVRLLINDFDIIGNNGSAGRQDKFYAFVEDLRERGAPVDAVGFQSHFWSTRLTPPEKIWETIDRFSNLGLPLYVTEFDMNFPDEQIQADYTRDFLTAWFSHPQTEGFIMWGFWANAHWFGESGAMYRENWDRKPNADAYVNLVFKDWWTDDSQTTQGTGSVEFRPFFGRHSIRVEQNGILKATRQVTHSPESPDIITIIVP